jgi:DNA polymerase-1
MSEIRPLKKGDRVFLIDGSSFIFRAYFAMFKAAQSRGKAFTRSDGLPVGAVMTFCSMMWKLMREGIDGKKPTHVGCIFDAAGDGFRNEIYPEYKANREAPPDDLIPQFPLMRDAAKAFGMKPIEEAGYEADDLIATYSREAREAGAEVLIIAGDKDLMQLVRKGVTMYDPMPGNERKIGEKEVEEKFGVEPERVPDVQALCGDSTDNVPGVPGIGIKTAALLIQEYGDLETLLKNAEKIKQDKRRQTLIDNAELARVSKKLVLLDDHAPLKIPLDQLGFDGGDPAKVVAFLKAMEFTRLTENVAKAAGIDPNTVEADPLLSAGAAVAASKPAAKEEAPAAVGKKSAAPSGELTPAALFAQREAQLKAIPFDHKKYETVTTPKQLDAWIARAREQGYVAVDTETTSLDAMQADLCGVSLSVVPGEACYIPLGHCGAGEGLFEDGLLPGQLPIKETCAKLKVLLEDKSVLKIGQNIKYDSLVLSRQDIRVAPYDDTMLMSYALDAGRSGGGHGMDNLALKFLGHKPIAFEEVAGKGKSAVNFNRVAIDRATAYAAEDADVTLRLWLFLKARLTTESMNNVYETLERPLVQVLADMEKRGIAIDRQMLSRLSGDFAQTTARLEDEISKIAGEKFNPGSPKQLGDILFGKMGLPGGTKTATGAWATGAKVLEDLAEEGHELPKKILEWRQLSKLKSTYTDALPEYVNPETKRVHTSYSLAATPTGRLASSEPNLQNIPVRTEEGRKIRKAFVAEKGNQLVSADYSQIELRLLAEIGDVPQLKKAFRENLDIHAMTASEMFGVPVKDMPGEVRRRAKAINFGIIYGISAFGLANQLGIGREEAGAYIKKYFERFPGIQDYMEETKKFARANGDVVTLFGRKVHYPGIKDQNPSVRGFNERAAINARLQGTAADIIRRAMIRMDATLAKAKLDARMLLQVHDELIFEVAEKDVKKTLPLVQKVMEEAPLPAVALSIPLSVAARAASNWEEAH